MILIFTKAANMIRYEITVFQHVLNAQKKGILLSKSNNIYTLKNAGLFEPNFG